VTVFLASLDDVRAIRQRFADEPPALQPIGALCV
jgi:hypothetical protein